jgi:hypothetical protein
MATHHWIVIRGIKYHVQVGDYSGVRESGPLKRDEEGDEDDHHGDDSPGGTPAPPRERGRESLPLVLPPPWPPPRWGEVLPLVLGLHGHDGPLRLPPPWPPVMMAPFGRVPERA